MASGPSGTEYPPGMPPPDWQSINSKATASAANPDLVMQDTDASLPSHGQQHPPYLYPPFLPANEGMSDHLRTPSASNRAQFPLVSLQPKSMHTRKQAPAPNNNQNPPLAPKTTTTNVASGNRSIDAGRRASLNRHNKVQQVHNTTPTKLAAQEITTTNDGFITVCWKVVLVVLGLNLRPVWSLVLALSLIGKRLVTIATAGHLGPVLDWKNVFW